MSVIHVVGLGPGDRSSLPTGSLQQLQSGCPVYFRTLIHPVIDDLKRDGIQGKSFDHLYESGERFEDIYEQMAHELVTEARRHGEIVYAVPGHPLMAEQSVQNLLRLGGQRDVKVEIGPGQSFLDAVCALLQIDPIEGLSLLDGSQLDAQVFEPRLHTLIVQVFQRNVASEVKLSLMDILPDDYEVVVVRAAGVRGLERSERIPLYALDRVSWIDHLTTVYVPPTTDERILYGTPAYVEGLVKQLRAPDGCPWDRTQTHQTLRRYVIEEAYEVAHAIDEDDSEHLADELGDLLFQVLLHAEIASELGTFHVRDVYAALADKLVRRHPHVFSGVTAETTEEAEDVWKAAKQAEQSTSLPDGTGLFADVRWGNPAATISMELQKRAARVGFDWPDAEGVIAKVREELLEVEETLAASSPGIEEAVNGVHRDRQSEELGDLLFTVMNLARWLEIEPEEALAGANFKFYRRMMSIEERLLSNGQTWSSVSTKALNELWNQIKVKENPTNKFGN